MTQKAHQKDLEPRPAVSLIPQTAYELAHLHLEMERDKKGVARQFTLEIESLEIEIQNLAEGIEKVFGRISLSNTARAQAVKQKTVVDEQNIMGTIRADSLYLSRLQDEKLLREEKLKELKGRRDGLGLTSPI